MSSITVLISFELSLLLTCSNEPPQADNNTIDNKVNEKEIVCYYLVYIDEGYSGNGSSIGIDKFGVTRNPFTDNWCVWSETQMLN